MTGLVWDEPGSKVFETGISKGVLYVQNEYGVAWNGLTKVNEAHQNRDIRSYYLDGVKYLSQARPGIFAGSISAYTYPDEFLECEGLGEIVSGLLLDNQPVKPFSLCYRSTVGNDTNGVDHSYKLHILYNLTAVPAPKTYASDTDSVDPFEFSWNIEAIATKVPGYFPSAHVILDTQKLHPELIQFIEDFLYGTADGPPTLLSPSYLKLIIEQYVPSPPSSGALTVTDNGNGTWTISGNGVSMVSSEEYSITGSSVVSLGGSAYTVSTE